MFNSKYNSEVEHLINAYFDKINILDLTHIVDEVGDIIKEYCLDRNFAIWGCGEHTDRLYYFFSNELKDAKCIIDNNTLKQGKKEFGFEIISPKKIHELSIDVILISSYASAKVIENQIQEIDKNIKVVNIYRILEDKKIDLQGAFYDNPGIYSQIYSLVQAYKNASCISDKEKYLEKIIYNYLYIRDFKNGFYYLEIYINNKYRKAEKFLDLSQKLKKVLVQMSCELKKNRENDVLLLLYDSMRSKDIEKSMVYLNKLKEEGTWFSKAYSPSIFTYESVPCVLTGKRDYKGKVVHEEDSSFLKNAIELGYGIKVYAIGQWNIIDGENVRRGEDSKYIALTYWNALCDLLQEEHSKAMYLVYIWQETHPPHMGGVHSIKPISHTTPYIYNDLLGQTQEEYILQYKEALKYADEQTEFYLNMLSSKSTKIIFSDHGQIIEEALQPIAETHTKLGWHTQRYHVPLIINGPNIESKVYGDIFSMLDFSEIMNQILKDNKIEYTKKEYVEVKFNPIYNNVIIENYKKYSREDYLYGYQIYLNDTYKIVFTGTGKTKLYFLTDEEKEIKDEKLISSIVKKLKDNQYELRY